MICTLVLNPREASIVFYIGPPDFMCMGKLRSDIRVHMLYGDTEMNKCQIGPRLYLFSGGNHDMNLFEQKLSYCIKKQTRTAGT